MYRPRSSASDGALRDAEWAMSIDRWILLVLLLVSVLGWSTLGWLYSKPMHPLLLVRTVIVGSCLAYLSAFALSVLVRGGLYLASARYRRARRSASARKRLGGERLRLQHEP